MNCCAMLTFFCFYFNTLLGNLAWKGCSYSANPRLGSSVLYPYWYCLDSSSSS